MPISDNSRRWAVMGLLFFGMVISYVDRGNVSIAAVPLMREFGFTPVQLGLLMSMFFWTYAAFQIPAGHLIDRFGIRRIYAAAFIFWCFAAAGMGLARNFSELAILRLLLGMFEAVSPLATMAFIKQNFAKHEQGAPSAIYVASVTLGPAIGAIAGASLIDAFGWRSMFVLTGLAGCFWVIPWWIFVPDKRSSPSASADDSTPSFRAFLNTSTAWGLAGSVFFYSYYVYFFLTWIPAYLVLKHGMLNLQMSLMMAAPLAGMAAVNLAFAAIADKVIRRRNVDAIRVRKQFVCAGFLSASLLMALAWVEKGGPVLPILLASLMGVGIGAGNYWALSQAAAPRDVIGRALGFQNMTAQFAGAAAPLVTGFLLGAQQDFRTAILAAGACPILAIAALVLLVRNRYDGEPARAQVVRAGLTSRQ